MRASLSCFSLSRFSLASLVGALAATAVLSAAAPASAAGVTRAHGALLVTYEPAYGCPAADPFHAELAARLANGPAPTHPARFLVRIDRREDGSFHGSIGAEPPNERITRHLYGASCTEITSAAALMIAMAAPLGDQGASTEATPLPALPAPVVRAAATTPAEEEAPREATAATTAPASSALKGHIDLGLGAMMRGIPDSWSNASGVGPRLELTGELRRPGWAGSIQIGGYHLAPTGLYETSWTGFDIAVAPVHIEPVEGFAIVPFGRFVGSYARSLDGYPSESHTPETVEGWIASGGAGARIRWMPTSSLYLDAQTSGMFGGRLMYEQAYIDMSASLGFRLE